MSGPILWLMNCFRPEDKRNKANVSKFSSAEKPTSTASTSSSTSTSTISPATTPHEAAHGSIAAAIMAMSTEPVKNPNGDTVLDKKELEDLKKFVNDHQDEIENLKAMTIGKINNEYQELLTKPDGAELLSQTMNLWMPHTLRYSYKDKKGLPRTIDFTFDHYGQPTVVIQTNQKIHVNENIKSHFKDVKLLKNPAAILGKGSYKIGKTCYTLANGKLVPIARLQYDITEPSDITAMLKEMEFAKRHKDSKYIDAPILGSLYLHQRKVINYNGIPVKDYTTGKILTKNVLGCYIYSAPAICSLDKLNGNDRYGNSFLTPKEKEQLAAAKLKGELPEFYMNLIKDALRGLAEIHAADEVHRDIKPDNILVYRDSQGQLHAKISDPGLAVTKSEKAAPTASFDYAAPQVFYANSTNAAPYNHYFFGADSCGNLTSAGRKAYDKDPSAFSPSDKYADPKDDMYALGVCIMEALKGERIYCNKFRNTQWMDTTIDKFKNDFQFGALLATQRKDRPSAAELLARLELKPTNNSKLTKT